MESLTSNIIRIKYAAAFGKDPTCPLSDYVSRFLYLILLKCLYCYVSGSCNRIVGTELASYLFTYTSEINAWINGFLCVNSTN